MVPIRATLGATLLASLLACGAASAATAPAARRTHPATLPTAGRRAASSAAIGSLPGGNDPFWLGRPDAREFARRENLRLTRAKQAIARMLAVRGPRTAENTLRPYDDSQLELDAMLNQSSLMENVHPDSGLRTAAEKATQDGSSYATEISLNRRVWQALKSLDVSKADPETRYYVERTLLEFHLSGVDKDDSTRARIKRLNDEIVKTSQEFDRNIRSDQPQVTVSGPAEMEGLPADFVAGHKPDSTGRISIGANEAEYFPVETYAKNPDLRRRMWIAFNNRAYPKNMAVLDSLISKYAQLAWLIGYPTYADLHTADKMAGSARNVRDFIDHVVQVSGDRAARETQTLLERKRKDDAHATTVEYWDRFYYPEMVRRERYNFDSQVLRPYFPFEQVRNGVLEIASRMFGVTFKRVPNAPVWDPSVECWQMYEGPRLVGRFYFDMHPRKDKYDHAAEFDVRTGVEGRQIPEAALVCNLPGGKAGEVALCEMDDVNTMFHEFGHLLHALFAGHHRWVGIGGIRTERDFVEAPSQMLEEWMRDPRVLRVFAKHYQTGAPIPDSLLEQKRRADSFAEGGQGPRGLYVRRQMVLADLSLGIYNAPPSEVNTDALYRKLNDAYVPYPWVNEAHPQCSFGHLAGYTAGYYTYMWSEVIAKDLFSKFNHENLLDPVVARRYRDTVLAPGGSAPVAKLVERFLGRPFNFDAYKAWLDQPVIP